MTVMFRGTEFICFKVSSTTLREAWKVSKKYGKMVSMHGRCAVATVMALFYMFR